MDGLVQQVRIEGFVCPGVAPAEILLKFRHQAHLHNRNTGQTCLHHFFQAAHIPAVIHGDRKPVGLILANHVANRRFRYLKLALRLIGPRNRLGDAAHDPRPEIVHRHMYSALEPRQ